ncbi:MAG TPA: ATP-binding protein [Marinobacter sp.]|nr:ATP-binding protein [Marinobacter sp.]
MPDSTLIKASFHGKCQKEVNLRSFSLGTRLAIIILAGTLTTVAAVLYIAYSALVNDFEDMLTSQQRYETSRIAASVDQKLQARINVLSGAAGTLTDGHKLYHNDELEHLINRQKQLQQLFPGGLVILDETGTAIVESSYVPNRLGTNYADRSHIKRAKETRQLIISPPIVGRTTHIPLISFVAPIQSDDNDLLGFIIGALALGKTSLIPSDILTEIQTDDAIFEVVDTHNFLYVESATRLESGIRPLPNPGEDPLIDAALSGITFGRIEDASGKELIYATSHLQRLGWLFIRAVPYAAATAPAQASFLRFFNVSLGIAALIALISFILMRSATAPLDRITRKIENMIHTPSEAARLGLKGPPEVRNLAQAFNRLMDERDAISEMKENFVSNISHELRTPLTSINGALKLMDSGAADPLPERAKEMNKLALRNGQRLQLLISDLLDLSKLSAGKFTVTLEQVTLLPVIQSALAGSQATADEHNILLSGTCDASLVVVADGHRLRQVLDNFISNAIKFSNVGGKIHIRVEPATQNRIRIIVHDEGKGVPEHFIPRLFDRFAQAEEGSIRSVSGTGLGLAICRDLASLMDGQVGYYYRDGANFWIELARA